MVGRKVALLVATDRYQDTSLNRLAAPASDAKQLAAVLRNTRIAGYAVTTLYNKPHHVVGRAIGDFYRDRRRDDLTLLYFTGHGVKDEDGNLYLAMTDTDRENLQFTGVPCEQIRAAMEVCRSQQKVLVLDCCYAGAFPLGLGIKGDPAVHALEQLGGRGCVVLTSSDAMQLSFEGSQVTEVGPASLRSGPSSLFTRFLIEGLRTGKADLDGDGDITLDELYSYVHDRVTDEQPLQRPKKKEDIEGRICFAQNIYWTLPSRISDAVNSPYPPGKLSALQELRSLHNRGNAIVKQRVLETVRVLARDDSKSVSAAANQFLSELVQEECLQAEEQAQRDADEAARRQAEEQAQRDADEAARRQAEEQAQRDADEAARRQAEEQAQRDADEAARRQAEEQAQRDADEAARRQAEEQAQRDADEAARRQAEEQAQRDADEAVHASPASPAPVSLAAAQSGTAERTATSPGAGDRGRQTPDEGTRRGRKGWLWATGGVLAAAVVTVVAVILATTSPGTPITGAGAGSSSSATASISLTSLNRTFSAMSTLKPLAAAGKGNVVAILPDTVTSARYTEFDAPYLSQAFGLAGLSSSQYSVENAQGSDATQLSDAQEAITRGASVLIVDPLDFGVGAQIESYAKSHGVKVIDYDRLTFGGSRQYYVSFNNVQVGTLIGKGFVACATAWHVSKPNVLVMKGAPTDNNATLYAQGYDAVLAPLFSAGTYVQVGSAAGTWDPPTAESEFQQQFTAHKNINSVVTPNDENAAPIIHFLQTQGVKPMTFPVTGQDATLVGLQNILSGYQCGTVYKPIYLEAQAAVALAMFLRTGQTPPAALVNGSVTDLQTNTPVPSVLATPEWVTTANMNSTVIADQFVSAQQLCVGSYAAECRTAGISG